LLVRDGLSQNEIAEHLSLSPRTVEQHLRSAYRKAADHWQLESMNQTQLVRLLMPFWRF
jgi:DNA-binding CsgD family transcriptional regulator